MPDTDTQGPAAETNRFARHPVRWLVGIVLVSFVAFVAAGEFMLSQMDLAPELQPAPKQRYIRLREWVPDTAFTEAPPQIRFLNPGGPVQQQYRIETDRHGFIKPTEVHADPEVKIVFVGGSTTETLFVSEDKRFPYLAGRLIEERTGKRINSYNAGKSGNNVMHSTFVLLSKVVPMKPDYVVLMHAANDIGVLKRFGTYWPDDSDFGHIRSPFGDVEGAIRTLRDATIPRLYRVFRNGFSEAPQLRLVNRAYAQTVTAEAPPKLGPADAWGIDFRNALLSFVRTAQSWGIRPVLMTQAVELKGVQLPENDDGGAYLAPQNLARAGFTAETFGSTHAYFNAITRGVARDTGAVLIDLERAYPWSANELYDALHFSDQGSEVVAGIVAEALAPDVEALLDGRNAVR